MGIKYDIREIEQKLDSLITQEAKLKYLNDYLMGLRNQLATFEAFESSNLLRLQEVSKNDYNLYGNFLDEGGLYYFNSRLDEKTNKYIIYKSDQRLADKLGIKDLSTLLRRKSLEAKLSDLKGRIILIKGLLDNIKSTNPETTPLKKTERKTPTAPAVALFCNLINESEIIKKESNEIPETYCNRICEIYNLKYTDRVRQNFYGKKSNKHYKELSEIILPIIDVITKDKIQQHLDSKNPPTQKLYV